MPSLRTASLALSEYAGLDLGKLFRSIRRVPGYLADRARFRKQYGGPMSWRPCLHDRDEEAGRSRGEYFVQDLYVARKIHACKPKHHVDVGSRVDGFVAHVAAFRQIEVWDIRPISSSIPGVRFRQADLMDASSTPRDYCDSLSCLHALEHFGLGRYGDPLDAEGSRRGFLNMAAVLQPGGRLHLSVPVGKERVLFNSHRIFDPATIDAWARERGLQLIEFACIGSDDAITEYHDWPAAFEIVRGSAYLLGVFCFQRPGADGHSEGKAFLGQSETTQGET